MSLRAVAVLSIWCEIDMNLNYWYFALSQTDKHHFTSLLSHYLFPDQEMRPHCEWVQFLSLGCWILQLSHWLKHSRIFCFLFLLRAKGHGNSFWAVGLSCCQWRQTDALQVLFEMLIGITWSWNIIILLVWTCVNVHILTKGVSAFDLNAFGNVSSFLLIKVEQEPL